MPSLKITFTELDGTVKTVQTTDANRTVMEAARANGVEGILADCGGACSCATCHVYVDPDWTDIVGPPNEIECELLDMVADLQRPNSRLSCQIQLRPELDGLKVEVAPIP